MLPFTTSARPIGSFRFVVNDAGDQTDPSIDGEYVIFAGPGPGGSGTDVLLYDGASGLVRVVAGGPGEQLAPDVWRNAAIFLEPGGVSIRAIDPPESLRAPAADGAVGAPVIGEAVAAWEVGPQGGRDVRVSRYLAGEEYTLRAPDGGDPVGDQYAPAVWGALVGYVDGRDQDSVWVHDSAAGTARRICAGRASGLSLGEGEAGGVVAVARAAPERDSDIEVYDLGGALLAALRVPGIQQRPHLSREWVAFEDVSTEFSQVVLWNWVTGLVYVPHPTKTQQILNDLSFFFPEEVRLVFEDTERPESGRDIALYVLDVYPEILFDDQPDGYPFATAEPPQAVLCDPATPALATLELARTEGRPEAGRVEVAVPVTGADPLPVVVCIEAEHVSAAWVMLDDVAIATPADFEPSVVSLARPANLEAGTARLSGVLAGKPGSWLRARIVVDPSRAAPAAPAPAPDPRAASLSRAKLEGSGCGTGVDAGLLSLLALLSLAARRRCRA